MKNVKIMIALALCLSLLSACGKQSAGTSAGNSTDKSLTSDASTSQSASGNTDAAKSTAGDAAKNTADESDFLAAEYDYNTNELCLRDLSSGTTVASYSFETTQTPLLTERINEGVIMLSSQSEPDIQNTNGGVVITGDNSAETLYYRQFDKEMNLLKQYDLTDETLVDDLLGYVLSVSPDGESLVYAVGSSLYRYTFATQKLEEITPVMSETVYYEAVHYSDSGKHLAFYGSMEGQEDATAYGTVNLDDGTAKVFTANNFSGTTLVVNGEYAAIADAVLPNSMGGAAATGNVLYLDLAKQEGKELRVESGEESGLVGVSADGRYVITCAGGDGSSGVVRAYQTGDGAKAVDQDYTMETACKPHTVLVLGSTAYAVLGTEGGNLLSPAVKLP